MDVAALAPYLQEHFGRPVEVLDVKPSANHKTEEVMRVVQRLTGAAREARRPCA